MPFDGTGFVPAQPDRRRPAPSDNVVTALIIAITFALLAMPVSLAALVDIVRYLRAL